MMGNEIAVLSHTNPYQYFMYMAPTHASCRIKRADVNRASVCVCVFGYASERMGYE